MTRHAQGAPTKVHLSCTDKALELEVENDPVTEAAGVNGDTNGTVGGGHGILGMLERATRSAAPSRPSPRANGGIYVRARSPASASR